MHDILELLGIAASAFLAVTSFQHLPQASTADQFNFVDAIPTTKSDTGLPQRTTGKARNEKAPNADPASVWLPDGVRVG